jgi:sec-independent protein translocase protein TatA
VKLFEPEILILLAIVLIIFGPKQLPKLGETIGRTIREFRSEVEGKPGASGSKEPRE